MVMATMVSVPTDSANNEKRWRLSAAVHPLSAPRSGSVHLGRIKLAILTIRGLLTAYLVSISLCCSTFHAPICTGETLHLRFVPSNHTAFNPPMCTTQTTQHLTLSVHPKHITFHCAPQPHMT